jgi:hypothetical protein
MDYRLWMDYRLSIMASLVVASSWFMIHSFIQQQNKMKDPLQSSIEGNYKSIY